MGGATVKSASLLPLQAMLVLTRKHMPCEDGAGSLHRMPWGTCQSLTFILTEMLTSRCVRSVSNESWGWLFMPVGVMVVSSVSDEVRGSNRGLS